MATLAGLYGPQAILSTAGIPAKNTPVTVYKANTTTVASLYTTHTATVSAANPVNTDGYGNLHFFAAPGIYTLSFTVGGVATTVQVEVLPYYTTLTPPPAGRIAANAAKSIPSSTTFTIVNNLGTAQWLYSGMTTGTASKLIAPVKGLYRASFALAFNAAVTGIASVFINGAEWARFGPGGSAIAPGKTSSFSGTTQLHLTPAGYVQIGVSQTSGAAHTIVNGTVQTWFDMELIGRE